MATTKQPLKYLWTAIYDDGGSLMQPEDDRSKNHDEKAEWNPSAFRDIDQDKVEMFVLTTPPNEKDEVEAVAYVNLKNGLFWLRGQSFVLHQNVTLKEKPRLIYYREVQQDFIDGVPQDAYVSRYFIGWQAKDKRGKNHKYTIGIE